MDGFQIHRELLYWFAFLRLPVRDIESQHILLREFKSPVRIFSSGNQRISEFGLLNKTIDFIRNPPWERIKRDLAWYQSPGNDLITIMDERYPKILKEIHDPPLALYLSGNPKVLNCTQISIVGSRRPTTDGKRIARDLAGQLAGLGITITSGLAAGLDSCAHLGALDADGQTIAVLGSGLNMIYPPRNKNLAGKIARKGAVVSEFPPDFAPKPVNFPRRNRIISGLSTGTLVVEAALKSGSLITAGFALEQGREVFAVPGSIYNPLSRGCHGLIRQGAKLVENINDILDEIAPLAHLTIDCKQDLNRDVKKIKGLDECCKLLLDNIGSRPVSVDYLVEETNLTANVVTAKLINMELMGVIESTPGGRYIRL